MDISAFSSAADSLGSKLGLSTNSAIAPVNLKVGDPAITAPNTNIVSNAATSPVTPTIQNTNVTFIPSKDEVIVPLLGPIKASVIPVAINNPDAQTRADANVGFVPDNAEVIVPLPAPVNTAGVSTIAASPITPPIQNTQATVVPSAPEAIIPLPAAVNTAGVSTSAAGPVIPPIESMSSVPVPADTVETAPDITQVIIPPLAAFNIMGGESVDIKGAPKEDTSGTGDHGEVAAVIPPQQAFNNGAEELAEAKFTNSTIPSKGRSTGKRAQDYLHTISKRAQATDREFRRQNLPYRFKVLTDNNENVLIDLSILDGQGKVIKHETRNVTNENFGALMDDISTGKGLLIDHLPQR